MAQPGPDPAFVLPPSDVRVVEGQTYAFSVATETSAGSASNATPAFIRYALDGASVDDILDTPRSHQSVPFESLTPVLE